MLSSQISFFLYCPQVVPKHLEDLGARRYTVPSHKVSCSTSLIFFFCVAAASLRRRKSPTAAVTCRSKVNYNAGNILEINDTF